MAVSGIGMPSVFTNVVHIVSRLVLMCCGALLLWAAPVSLAGLALMFVGLVCAVGGLTLEKTEQF
jgi:hypothetical protein